MLFLVPPHNFSPDDRPSPRPRLPVLLLPPHFRSIQENFLQIFFRIFLPNSLTSRFIREGGENGGELRQLEETRSIDFTSFVRPFSILLSTCVTASILPSDWPFFTPPLRASRPYSPSFQLHPPRQLLTRLTPNVQAFYSGNSCRSKTSTTESRFMGTTLPPDTPQREYIDR